MNNKHEKYAYEVVFTEAGPRGLARKPRTYHQPFPWLVVLVGTLALIGLAVIVLI